MTTLRILKDKKQMTDDKELEQQLEQFIDLGKTNPQADTATLATETLEKFEENKVSGKSKAWAYFISLGFPPLGLLLAVHYFFSEKTDAKQVARMCILLTVVSIGAFFIFLQILSSSMGTSYEQIQGIDPNELRELLQ
jgi:hypothetical protein